MKMPERAITIEETKTYLYDAVDRLQSVNLHAKFDKMDDANLMDAWEAASKALKLVSLLPGQPE